MTHSVASSTDRRATERSSIEPRLGDRNLFPQLEARAYLAHAAVAPASLAVQLEVSALLEDYSRKGVGAFPSWLAQRAELKGLLAKLVGGEPAEIALTSGTTRGITDIALCIPWRQGDRVVLLTGEFPANVTPWQRAAALYGLDLVYLSALEFLEDDEVALERLERELRRGVRLVAVSAVQFQTGHRMPLERIGELCHRRGAELAVDGIQACGVLPCSVRSWHADYLACGAHKFLMGLEGAGFLWINPEVVGALRPHVAGWLSHERAADFLFRGSGQLRYDRPLKKSAEVFEGGTITAVGHAALGASVRLILDLGPERIFQHVTAYLDRLEAELQARGFTSLRARKGGQRSANLCVRVPDRVNAEVIHRGLIERGIECSFPDGNLRFSPHWPNSLEEIPWVVEAVDETLALGHEA